MDKNLNKINLENYEIDQVCSMLNDGLKSDPLNVNLLYALAGLCEIKNRYINAYILYKKISKISSGIVGKIAKIKINEYEKLNVIEKYNRRKKVLIISYIFPPLGGSGVQRTLKFVKYLRDFDYEPIVVTVLCSEFMPRDDSLLYEIPEDVQIVRIEDTVGCSRYYKDFVDLYGGIVKDNYLIDQYEIKLLELQDNFEKLAFVTDTNAVWAMEVLDKIGDIVDFDGIDLIYSTSGPYSDHVIGYYLKERYEKPWISDFRDEWTNNPYFVLDDQSLLYKMQRKMEGNILKYADVILTVSEMSMENYIEEFNLDQNRIKTITNGYDEADFEDVFIGNRKNDKFTVIFNGSLYLQIVPYYFIIALNELIEEKSIQKDKIDVEFVGKIEENILNRIVELDKYGIVSIKNYMSHMESLKNAGKADLLLLIIGKDSRLKSVYTGKVFEYLRLCRKIMSLSPEGSLVEKLIEKTHRGKNFEIDDIQGMKQYILEIYEKWKYGQLGELKMDSKISRYERRKLTEVLTTVFDGVISKVPENVPDSKEKQGAFYNSVYESGGWNETYFKHYSETQYFPIWSKSLEIIKNIGNVKIIDIGCGVGQFANFVFDSGITNYKGIDFSEEAVKMAKIRNDKYRNLFKVDNAYTSDIVNGDYNTAVMFEVLEHLNDDIGLIKRLKTGSNIIFSVPNFYSAGHVRWFNSKMDILKRYNAAVHVDNIYIFNIGKNNRIYLVWGIKS
ncbi:methyltransferase domain-containing protein [Clostridium luticellarii]|jgi:2-polyprenyl-3-methyl-5-hydroxy-6-metoxy-1,4-benzoquinol methylase|uniref:Bifunctional 3-demethylubiquinone-9 3-methyltransferase/ 2-octaprenyl-6-hydroxy phenol methylase n=1 Tax=Clostridium luticellarii TaxID=1691940 RepID=A0A2T0BQY9_9CLOT|nr:methyltransferase domain-containing protein [Clostridium luticellarii]MCI1946303.1 methyltransferase domain-containing protein [Clostridium luticellarii]MCI1969504.1 methyltransferase domain-containing protein [Clostridium luticellarii]MCI1996681.1 methyltransferase domain-containing protein [Clostridium luticellarii]PRR86265.1 bifunctional 3-demethylubiquinone-9 3-methyltransferase/ 2-octaprenyl-6-hydroxy phenol methylase [Clostridium luticellarii]